MLRGENGSNPPLILLHGGLGFTEMRLFRHFNAPLEKCFTVVNWDQRGAGKSFDRKIPKSSMTVEQFIADLDELVDTIRRRLGRRKVTIFGHSWGSALGVLYAARFPDKVAAYVGSGQIGDWPAGELSSYAFVLAELDRRNNRKAVKELRAIGAPPLPPKNCGCNARGLIVSRGAQGVYPCGSSGESCSGVRNRRSSIYRTSSAAFYFLSTPCGPKYRR
jgi:pimeloyl-ACP methyl ester carboxylesterase